MGGVVLISLSPSACVLVCERRREGTGDSGVGVGGWEVVRGVDARWGGKRFRAVGVFPRDVKHLCRSGEVMCEVLSNRSAVRKGVTWGPCVGCAPAVWVGIG